MDKQKLADETTMDRKIETVMTTDNTEALREQKGQRKHGPCNVTSCQQPGATHWNTSTLAWYCQKCATAINAVPMSTPPLCVHMNSLPPEAAHQSATEHYAQRIKELEAENFRLAAGICPNGYGDEYGNYHCGVSEQMQTLVEALRENPAKMADADLMFCINGAHEDFSHLPYEDVKAIAKRVCAVIASRINQALATIEHQPAPSTQPRITEEELENIRAIAECDSEGWNHAGGMHCTEIASAILARFPQLEEKK